MKFFRIFSILTILGLLLWGIINPNGFRAAIANNRWSLEFADYFYAARSDSLLSQNPPSSHPHAKLLLAREAIDSGNDQLALAYITPLIGPDNPLITNSYAEIMYRQENYIEAIRAWEMAGNLTALHNTTYELREKKLLDAALLAAQSRYNLERETSTSSLATILSDQKNFNSAIELLDQSMTEFPDSKYFKTWVNTKSGIQFVQAIDYASNGMLSEAEQAYRASVTTNPNNWGAWKRFGWFYYYSYNDFQSAIDCFRGEITANPENGEGQFDLAQLYAIEKQVESAGYWYEQAIALRPDRRDFQLHYANFLRGTQDLVKAVEIYDRLLLNFPDYADAYYEAAKAYAQFEQPAKAIQSIERAIQLSESPALRFYLLAGALYEGNGLKEKALEVYRDALMLDPNSPDALNAIKRLSD